MRVESRKTVSIGALGEKEFEKGVYIYVGSAQKSVEKRLKRHYSRVENTHWHIDYLTEKADVFDHLVLPENSDYECTMASLLSLTCEPVESFGSSDCSCESHLFKIPNSFDI